MSRRRTRRHRSQGLAPRRILYAVDVLDAYTPCDARPANDNAAMPGIHRIRHRSAAFLRIVPGSEGVEVRTAP
ncbi:hypothetical protein [Methylobacterium sp. ID0610]|uniref:hypothetical protein n=1 Tax=Methylobacterium carpenticola TaxID=3344827 RepID=UPI00369DC9E8